MIFSNKQVDLDIGVKINDVSIKRVECTKFLGVLIDNKLTWKEHIINVKGKLSKSLAILYRCSKLIDENALRTLYCSLFLAYLNYCCEVWGTTYKSNLRCLVILQKKAIRIISKVDRFANTTPFFMNLGLLKFEDIVKFKCCSIMYSAYKHELPSKLQCMFNVSNAEQKYNLRAKTKFEVKYVRTTKSQHCLSVFGVKMFNSLPNVLASQPNIYLFKKSLKKFILDQYRTELFSE